jgi:superfamily II DNA or RNA helicase
VGWPSARSSWRRPTCASSGSAKCATVSRVVRGHPQRRATRQLRPEPWQDKNQVITSISWVSRIDDAKESLLRSRWDLVIVDEAHKMAAYSADKKTLAYRLGESLSRMTDHYLLMTATPHKGDPENFCLFLELLDRDIYGSVKSLEEAMRRNEAPFYLRRTKEALVSFPDPRPARSHRLFTNRDVRTSSFNLDGPEAEFYEALTHYVEDQSIKAAEEDTAEPGADLHHGHAPAALRIQHLRRPPQP